MFISWINLNLLKLSCKNAIDDSIKGIARIYRQMIVYRLRRMRVRGVETYTHITIKDDVCKLPNQRRVGDDQKDLWGEKQNFTCSIKSPAVTGNFNQRYKMPAISQIFLNTFSWINSLYFNSKFTEFFPMIQLTICNKLVQAMACCWIGDKPWPTTRSTQIYDAKWLDHYELICYFHCIMFTIDTSQTIFSADFKIFSSQLIFISTNSCPGTVTPEPQ